VYLLEHTSRRSVGLLLGELFQQSLHRLSASFGGPRGERQGRQNVSLPVETVVWGPGQLDLEIRQGIWLRPSDEMQPRFELHDDLWIDLVRQIGRSVLRDALGIQDFDQDPHLN
jgi:putative AlgH/UPF0301 family transcriptional regulator